MTLSRQENLLVETADFIRNRFFGKYRGKVSDNDDPEKLGRIKALVPEVLGDIVSGWALPCAPYSGNKTGHYTIPSKDAGVWIEFEAGDPSRPIWSGCWWGSKELPTDNSGSMATPNLKIIRSEKGLMVTLDDSGQTITVSDKNGANMLEIKVSAKKITIKGASKAVVEAPQIELVENSKHPVVFGDDLLNYLSQLYNFCILHNHPDKLLPPSPPYPVSPPSSMLSSKVKTG
jgi:uncharacterized protein involved in type VI secretion and phage assembly